MKSILEVLYSLLRFLGFLNEPAPLRINFKRNRVCDDCSSDEDTPALGYKQVKRFRRSDILYINDNWNKEDKHSNSISEVSEKSSSSPFPKESPRNPRSLDLGSSRNQPTTLLNFVLDAKEKEPIRGSQSEKTQKKPSSVQVDLNKTDSEDKVEDDVVKKVTTLTQHLHKHCLTKNINSEDLNDKVLIKILEALHPDEHLDYQNLLQRIAISGKPMSKRKPIGDGKFVDATSFRSPQKIQVNTLNGIKLDSELNAGRQQNTPKKDDPVRVSSSDSSDSDIEIVPPESSTKSLIKKDMNNIVSKSRKWLLELDSKYNKVQKTQDMINNARRLSEFTYKVNGDQNIAGTSRTDTSEVLLPKLNSEYNTKQLHNKPEIRKKQENRKASRRMSDFTQNGNSDRNDIHPSSPESIDDWLRKLDAKYCKRKERIHDVQPSGSHSTKQHITKTWHSKSETKYKINQIEPQEMLIHEVHKSDILSKVNEELDTTSKWLASIEAEYSSSPKRSQDNVDDDQNDVLIVETKFARELRKSKDQLDGAIQDSDSPKQNSETNKARSYLPAAARDWLSKLDAEYKTAPNNQENLNKAKQTLTNPTNLNVDATECLAELKPRHNTRRRESINIIRDLETVSKINSDKCVTRSHGLESARKKLAELEAKHKTEQSQTQIILDDTHQELNNSSNVSGEQNEARTFKFNTSEDLMMKLGSLCKTYQQETKGNGYRSNQQDHEHRKSKDEHCDVEIQSNGNFELPSLTPEQEKMVEIGIAPEPEDELLVEKFNMMIHRRDLRTLSDEDWLNDAIINFYMNLIMQRSEERKDLPKVYSTNTFFYPKLMQSGQAGLRRWTRKVDIFAYDLFMVPVNIDRHWCLIIVDFRTRVINYLDSQGRPNEDCLDAVLQYLKDEHQEKKGASFNDRGWKTICRTDIPQQMNGSDCGMFACTFAEFSARDAAYSFTQAHMPYLRRKAALEILSGALLL